jgi:hypothetical protein
MTPDDLLGFLRQYIRDRAPHTGTYTAMLEVREAVAQVSMFGTNDIEIADPLNRAQFSSTRTNYSVGKFM